MDTKNQNQNQSPNNPKNGGADHRSDTRKHQYRNHQEVNTNDENYEPGTQKFDGREPDFDDKMNNQEKHS